jgi:hypothetical protein
MTPNYRGVWLHSSTLDAGGGNIAIRGRGAASTTNANYFWVGVDLVSFNDAGGTGTRIETSGAGSISIEGVGGNNGNSSTHGSGINLYSDNGEHNLITASGSISLTGTAGTGSAVKYPGINQDGGTTNLVSSTGSLSLTGIAGTGANNYGISIAGTMNLGGNGTTNTTGHVSLIADRFNTSGTYNLRNTGNVNLLSNSASFNAPFSLDSRFVVQGSKTGLTLGGVGNTADITIDGAQTIAGPITVYGGNILVNENLNTTAGAAAGDVLLKASGDIVLEAAKSITTTGGDVVLWANSDGQTANGGVLFDAGASVATGGGHIWIGGGSGSVTWNGLTVGDGYAVAGRDVETAFAKVGATGINWEAGVLFSSTTLSSGGGNIHIAGQRNVRSTKGAGAGVINYNGLTGSSINAGSGTVTIDAQGNWTADTTAGFLTGLHPTETTGNLTIRSSNATQTNAITISATTTDDTSGLIVERNTQILSTAATNGGASRSAHQLEGRSMVPGFRWGRSMC